MKRHVKVYLDYFGYLGSDYIPCEVCGGVAVDIHHIKCRGMGGSLGCDCIENLMALCRSCHESYGDRVNYVEFLNSKHGDKLRGKEG